MKKNRKIKIVAMLAMALAVVMSFAACGGGEGGIGGFFTGLFSKNYWDAAKSRAGCENTMKISGKTITLTIDGEYDEETETVIEELYLSSVIDVDFPVGNGIKLNAEVVKSTLPAIVTLSLRVGYLAGTDTVVYKDVKLISNAKNLLPVAFYPPVAESRIVSYAFYVGDVAEANIGAYIQLKDIKITSIKA